MQSKSISANPDPGFAENPGGGNVVSTTAADRRADKHCGVRLAKRERDRELGRQQRELYPLAIEPTAITRLRPYRGNARTHSKKQIRQICDSIENFGFTNPVLIGDDDEIIAGHGRVEAAKLLGMESVPTLRLSHLNAAQRRAYVIADNKLALNAGWDREVLAIELQALVDLDFDIEVTGFALAEIDVLLDEAREASPDPTHDAEDITPPLLDSALAVTRVGDLWGLGRHQLLCGDSRERETFDRLRGGDRADLVFTDPPYNVPIDRNVCGLGRVRHREFAMAAGEMSSEAFTEFLQTTLGHAAASCRDGAITFVCMDWRHMGELLAAGRTVLAQLPLAFSPDPGQRFLYVGGTPDAWILNRRTLEILGTVKTVPKGGPVGQTGTSNIGHLLGVDTNGNLYTAGELSTVFGKTQGAYKYKLTGYSPTIPCCQAPRNISAAAASTGATEAP